MDKTKLINIFLDTLDKTENFKDSETTKHTFNDIIKTNDLEENVIITNSDTVSAGVLFANQGKTCILNMASYKHPGGGVERGAQAQEECLFRCSNLFHVVDKQFYPLLNNEALYTKDAIFIKDKYYKLMLPVMLDVITIAAVNLNGENLKSFEDTNEYKTLMSNKIKLMLSLAKTNGCENIILGAFGCGVFKNNPKKVSQMFMDELKGYGFNNVVFAVINDHNSVGNNFKIFSDTIGE